MSTQTRIADLVASPIALANIVSKTYKAHNTLTASGVAVTGPEVDLLLAGGSQIQGLNVINRVDATQYNVSTDDYDQKGAVGKIGAHPYTALRMDLNWGWCYTDLVRMITKYDVRAGLTSAIPLFWNDLGENLAVSAMKGVIAAEADLTIGDGTEAFSTDLLIDAAASGGLNSRSFKNVFVSPKTLAKMQKANINAYVPASQTDLGFASYAGFNLFVTNAFGDDTTVMAADGALAFATGLVPGEIGAEIQRDASAGNGGGGEILRVRNSVVIAPQGASYKGPAGPTMAQLATAANWSLVALPEDIGFRAIHHSV
ncbi:MAG: hypothetical protein ACRYGR_00175 [Janthinobacterium lividum]